MHIQSAVDLKNYCTMRLGGVAKALVEVTTKDDLLAAITWADQHGLPMLFLGDGSNVIFQGDYNGLVIVNRLAGFKLTKNEQGALLSVAAGENWDETVKRSVEMGLSGIEKLSFIPGTAGATPVQNVGAYGAEIADTFVGLEAYDLQSKQFVTLSKEDCAFGYRSSIFKSTENRRYIITSLTLQLSNEPPKPPFYDSLQRYLDEHGIREYTPQAIRDAVIAIRTLKLPDPKRIANTGSFFRNPIINPELFQKIAQSSPDIPHWPTKDGRVKIAAGWLIDHAGLKNYAAHGMRIYEQNALVFINESAKNYADLAAFREEVVSKVRDQFGLTLEQEPELI